MKYIKKFESFGTKELSNVYKAAIENRFVTLDSVHDSSTETAPVTAPPTPDTPIPSKPQLPFMPTQRPKPGIEERPMGMGFLMKTYEEFRMGGEVETAPVTAPPKPDTPIPSKPPLPFMPTKKPKPGTEERPMGTFEEVMSIFFSELNKIKDTSKGQEMLKNIENKYGNL